MRNPHLNTILLFLIPQSPNGLHLLCAAPSYYSRTHCYPISTEQNRSVAFTMAPTYAGAVKYISCIHSNCEVESQAAIMTQSRQITDWNRSDLKNVVSKNSLTSVQHSIPSSQLSLEATSAQEVLIISSKD